MNLPCPSCGQLWQPYEVIHGAHTCSGNQPVIVDPRDAALAAKDAELQAAKARIEALETEMIGLQEFNVKSVNGAPQAEFHLEGPVMKRIIEALCMHFTKSGAENFVETSFDIVPAVTASPGVQKVGPFTMTIQRKNGITPAQKCGILDATIATLRAEAAAKDVELRRETSRANLREDENAGLTLEVATLRAELSEARKVIEELVTLKDMKLHHNTLPGLWNSSAVEEDYCRRKPVAWEAARAFLARKEAK